MRKLNYVGCVMAMLFFSALFAGSTYAQELPIQHEEPVKTDFTEEEIEKFIAVNQKVIAIQQENEAYMIQAIEKEDLDLESFNEILKAQQGEETAYEASEEELASFNLAAQNIMIIQKDMQEKMEQAVVEEGMELEDFQAIMMAYQQSPELQQKVDSQLMKN